MHSGEFAVIIPLSEPIIPANLIFEGAIETGEDNLGKIKKTSATHLHEQLIAAKQATAILFPTRLLLEQEVDGVIMHHLKGLRFVCHF